MIIGSILQGFKDCYISRGMGNRVRALFMPYVGKSADTQDHTVLKIINHHG
jgi:hypothetical protein